MNPFQADRIDSTDDTQPIIDFLRYACIAFSSFTMCIRTCSLIALLLFLVSSEGVDVTSSKKGPKITSKVFFDVTIDGAPAGLCLDLPLYLRQAWQTHPRKKQFLRFYLQEG